MQDREYDAALSFAGEDRARANALAEALRTRGVRIFYDAYEKADIWGKNLYDHLSDVYLNKAQYCVMLLSFHYTEKVWTNHERKAAQVRAVQENQEYILPVHLGRAEVDDVLPAMVYLEWPPENAETIADFLVAKLSRKVLRSTTIPTDIEVIEHRKFDHKYTDFLFTLQYRHRARIELLFGLLKSHVVIWIDGAEVFRRALHTFTAEPISFYFDIEGVPCEARYQWFAEAFLARLFIAGHDLG